MQALITSLALSGLGAAHPIERLDPPTRAKVLMGLLALVILGVTMVVCIRLGGRWARRIARGREQSDRPGLGPETSDWASPEQRSSRNQDKA